MGCITYGDPILWMNIHSPYYFDVHQGFCWALTTTARPVLVQRKLPGISLAESTSACSLSPQGPVVDLGILLGQSGESRLLNFRCMGHLGYLRCPVEFHGGKKEEESASLFLVDFQGRPSQREKKGTAGQLGCCYNILTGESNTQVLGTCRQSENHLCLLFQRVSTCTR